MQGQGTIVGVGAMEYPAEFSGMNPDQLVDRAISKIMTLTSTYDHRIIQGAQSGEFLREVHELLLGDAFWDEIFAALRIPYEPVRWLVDRDFQHEGQIAKSARVIELINAYRTRGHLMADTDPLEYTVRKHPDLDITRYGLTLWDLDREFPVDGFAGEKMMKLRDILGVLRDAYCRRVGVEFRHISDPEERAWIQSRVEIKHAPPSRDEQLHILGRLNAAEAFETFLQTKYVGQKRFSLEGAETVIALLDAVLAAAAGQDWDEVVIGMPHRGRLNVLANIVGKPYAKIFNEFEGNIDPGTAQGSGDVKYHLGAEGRFQSPEGKQIAVSLTANPSHLEAVDPVLEGIVRAKQDLLDKGDGPDGFTVLPLMLHGDAAFAGQGVVAETLNLSELPGYEVGGTIHLVVNNQLGFTTPPELGRSSVYPTDVAKTVQAPIFHVNGDDPEACIRVVELAFEFRQKFKKDVVVDLVCYRRHGHNETDEPAFTQPRMYARIAGTRSVRKLYTETLVNRGDVSVEEAEQVLTDFRRRLDAAFGETDDIRPRLATSGRFAEKSRREIPATGVAKETLARIVAAITRAPEGFAVHPKLERQLAARAKEFAEGSVDWATAEALAFGSLVLEGVPVRLAGQDTARGTFSQRHAVLVDQKSEDEYVPLQRLAPDQAPFMIYDSLLSEYAAMGFDYGYSLGDPTALVCWEAQFGDFVNGAQIVVDQYIAAAEDKWSQRSSLTLLLPHGFEGQGPEHSSGRIERFLILCAEDNLRVVYPTTAAQYFHALRRQIASPVRVPLVCFTPKKYLRAPQTRSSVDLLATGTFQPVLDDPSPPATKRRVLLCSGKIAHEIMAERDARKAPAVVVRVEELYPFPAAELSAVLANYPANAELMWVQEEPENMGPWNFVRSEILDRLRRPVTVAARARSASPATGSASVHDIEHRQLLDRALAGLE
jgi:2-oxoglutarate dehydrogenase E1 component